MNEIAALGKAFLIAVVALVLVGTALGIAGIILDKGDKK